MSWTSSCYTSTFACSIHINFNTKSRFPCCILLQLVAQKGSIPPLKPRKEGANGPECEPKCRIICRSSCEMVPGGGIEPPTRGFSIHCSTPELPGHGNGVCRWVEAFYDLLQAVSRGFFTFFQCGRDCPVLTSKSSESGSSSRCEGTAYDPFSHLAKSMSAQRFEQKGRNLATVSSPQIGQLTSAPQSREYALVCVEVHSGPTGSSRRVLFR